MSREQLRNDSLVLRDVKCTGSVTDYSLVSFQSASNGYTLFTGTFPTDIPDGIANLQYTDTSKCVVYTGGIMPYTGATAGTKYYYNGGITTTPSSIIIGTGVEGVGISLVNFKTIEAVKKYIDDNVTGSAPEVVSYADLASFPVTGTINTLYIASNTGYCYTWNGTIYRSVASTSSGGSGNQTVTTFTAGEAIPAGNAVRMWISGEDITRVYLADEAVSTERNVIGVSKTSATANGSSIDIVTGGEVDFTGAVSSSEYYLGTYSTTWGGSALPSNTKLYAELNGNSNDTSGTGNIFDAQTNVSYGASGRWDGKQVASFNGINSTLTANAPIWCDRAVGQTFSISAKINLSGWSGFRDIVSLRWIGGHNWLLYVSNTWVLGFHGVTQNNTSYTVPTGTWVTVGATVATDGTMKVYVNGVLNQTFTGFVFGTPYTNHLSIGSADGGGEFFPWLISDILISQDELTAAKMLEIHNTVSYATSYNISQLTSNGGGGQPTQHIGYSSYEFAGQSILVPTSGTLSSITLWLQNDNILPYTWSVTCQLRSADWATVIATSNETIAWSSIPYGTTTYTNYTFTFPSGAVSGGTSYLIWLLGTVTNQSWTGRFLRFDTNTDSYANGTLMNYSAIDGLQTIYWYDIRFDVVIGTWTPLVVVPNITTTASTTHIGTGKTGWLILGIRPVVSQQSSANTTASFVTWEDVIAWDSVCLTSTSIISQDTGTDSVYDGILHTVWQTFTLNGIQNLSSIKWYYDMITNLVGIYDVTVRVYSSQWGTLLWTYVTWVSGNGITNESTATTNLSNLDVSAYSTIYIQWDVSVPWIQWGISPQFVAIVYNPSNVYSWGTRYLDGAVTSWDVRFVLTGTIASIKLFKTDSDISALSQSIGIVSVWATSGGNATVVIDWVATWLSGLTVWAYYYPSSTAGWISTTVAGNSIGFATSATSLFIK